MVEGIELARQKLIEKLESPTPLDYDDFRDYTSKSINWEDELKNWDDCKIKNLEINTKDIKDQDGVSVELRGRLVFLAHSRDSIKGKPQLIHQTMQRIPVVKLVQKYIKAKNPDNDKFISMVKLLDDKFDKRYDGNIVESLAFDFWIYRVIEEGKEYYLMSESKLTEEFSEMIGMKVNVEDISGLTDTLKLNKIATIFFVKEFKSAVSVIPPQKLIDFVKETRVSNGWTAEGFKDFLFSHQDGNIYEYTEEFNLLRISQFLSGKFEGYPLHLMKIGPVGTGKTTEAEAIDFKFKEELGILEAGTSRMKVLVPSFKEKPANLGYICNCNRVAIIDELMKMVSSSIQNQHIDANNFFGELNMLLEHKKRLVGSGNDNSTIVKTTAKVCITSNPLPNKPTIYNHLSVLDNTTLSRMLIWVQDKEETDKIYSKTGIRTYKSSYNLNPENTMPTLDTPNQTGIQAPDCILGNEYYDFLTIFDSCQQFLVNYDLTKVKEVFSKSVSLAREPMKQVWKARGLHHSILILDGLTKFRCLFKDSDSSFMTKEGDYLCLEKILTKMVAGWDTNLENQGFGGF